MTMWLPETDKIKNAEYGCLCIFTLCYFKFPPLYIVKGIFFLNHKLFSEKKAFQEAQTTWLTHTIPPQLFGNHYKWLYVIGHYVYYSYNPNQLAYFFL